jgi:hypothetical protein
LIFCVTDAHGGKWNLDWIIRMNYFHFVTIPLNQTLVHHRRDAAIGMNPIPPEQDSACTLVADDEERSWDSLASHGQIHVENTLCLWCLAIEVTQRNVGLDQVLSRTPQPTQQWVWHYVNSCTGVDQHLVNQMTVYITLEVQSLQMLIILLPGLLKNN